MRLAVLSGAGKEGYFPSPHKWKTPAEHNRNIENFIWFFKFELSFKKQEAEARRSKLRVVI